MMVLNFDVILASKTNVTGSVYRIVKFDRLTNDEPIELDFDKLVSLTKSFIKNNDIVANSSEFGIPDVINEKIIQFLKNTENSKSEYEQLLTGLRYSDLDLFIIARTDLDVPIEEVEDCDVKSYLLDGLGENTTGTTNFFIGSSKSYINEGEGIYPYAIDFVDKLGLSESDMNNYDMSASLSNYSTLKEMGELATFDDSYAKNLITAMGYKFIRFSTY